MRVKVNRNEKQTKSNCKENNIEDIKLENVTFSERFQKHANHVKNSNPYCPAIVNIANANNFGNGKWINSRVRKS